MPQTLPSGSTAADKIARELARLRGPEIAPADGTLVAEDLRAQGGAAALARATIRRALAQAHPSTATDLLPELEEEYGLPNGAVLPTAERQQLLLAKYRARGDGSLLALATTTLTLVAEADLVTIAAADVEDTDPAAVFNLVVLVSQATMNDAGLRARVDALLAQQATGHVRWTFGRGDGPDIDPFLCDRADSACDYDLLAS